MPIRWRLTIFNALAIGAILLLLGFALFFLLREALLANVESAAKSRAVTAAHTIASGDFLSPDDVERLTLDGVFVIIRNRQGRVLSETVNLAPRKGSDYIWKEALAGGKAAYGSAELSQQAPDYVYAVPVTLPNGQRRVVEAGKSYQSAQETLEDVGTVLAFAIGGAVLLSIAGAYFLARTALGPVDAVVSAAREMSEGDLTRRLPVANPPDEIGRLATTINVFLARIEAAFARREEALARQRRFAADASHELRTPLTSISGYAKMLGGWASEEPETVREGAHSICRESERMRRLVEDLLTLTRGDEGAPLNVGLYDLKAVAEEAARIARSAAGGKVSVSCAPPPEPVEAVFDREKVLQAALILLDNAVKYTPESGKVQVSVSRSDGAVKLSVSDTGAGIPQEDLPLVFERFYRADSARTEGGAGLGLSIARQIAEAHGGSLSVKSRVGEGSVFTLVIPAKPAT